MPRQPTKLDNLLYRRLFESAAEAIAIVDRHGNIQSVNQRLQDLFGFTEAELINKRIEMLLPETLRGKHVHLRNDFLKKPTQRPMGLNRNLVGATKDGRQFPIEVSLNPVETEDGLLVMALISDISERVRLREQLIQADKMTTLGTLVSGVAHEINNPNNFILLNANILKDVWRDALPVLQTHHKKNRGFRLAGMSFEKAENKIGRLIDGTGEGARRIKNIVESLKNFARMDQGGINQQVNVNTIIESAITITHNLIKRSTHRFSRELAGDIPPISGNAQQLEQVIINLLTNACQSLPNPDCALAVSSRFNEEDSTVIVTVTDQGQGISKEDINQIFDPFFTTKRTSGGTGLGLSISYRIVKEHNGKLNLESPGGKGAIATLMLPVDKATKP